MRIRTAALALAVAFGLTATMEAKPKAHKAKTTYKVPKYKVQKYKAPKAKRQVKRHA